MSDRPFVHLHCHSHYSLLDGAGPIDKLVTRAKEHGMNALAITDHGNLHGALEFYRECKKQAINPIIGYEAYIAPDSRFIKDSGNMKEASYHLTLLAQNRTGFKNLVKLASSASLEGFYFKPRIDKEILEAHSEGIICLSGCVSGEFSRALLSGGDPEEEDRRAMEIAGWFSKVFGDRYFVEIMNNGIEIQRIAMEGAVRVANKMGLPLVTTCDTHYVDREDAEAQDVLLCINTGKFRTDTNRMKMDGNQYYLKKPSEMYDLFPGLEDAVARTQQIADTVSIDLELGKRHFPVFKLPPEKTTADYLREIVLAGLKERYADKPERWAGSERGEGGELSAEVMARVDRELDVINKLGFPNYFLIVWDFVRHARECGVPATARGSGVGALVCYALYLSHVCPIEYDLLFERFLDVSRLEAPDIDIDFCKERRGEIIKYVKDKYGEEMVAQIGTFGTLAARAAIKDVGRALGVPLGRVTQITEMVPEELNISLDDAIEKSPDLKAVYNSDEEIRELLNLARKIEGLARNVGTHAAAVVIADKPLTEYLPLGRVTGKTDVITQWAMADVEAAGLLKMDFLGLRNLTMLAKSVELIEQTTGKKVDPHKFPLDDKPTYALLCRGETKGIFQLESGGIRELLQRMKPDRFHDIIATNALYRPGPLKGGMVDEYVDVKLGRKKPEYKHPVMKEVLEETNGVMVYQEQVMRILNRLGGIELAAAYTVIKAISKKQKDKIDKNYEYFIAGAVKNGMSKVQAEEVWALIIEFAGYGFNKCVVGDTRIVDARTGVPTTVKSLFDDRREFHIHALDDSGKIGVRRVTDVMSNGRKQVFRLRTAQGHEIIATGNHPFRTLEGWTNLADLSVGDAIAAPRILPVAATAHWPRHEVIVLAGLLSEGNVCHPSSLYFYNNDRGLIDAFAAAAEEFPNSVARITERRPGRFEVCVNTGKDQRFQKGRKNPPQAEAREVSGIFRWAGQLGILGSKAADKTVPPAAFGMCDEDLELFLGWLWAGDGFVGAAGQTPYYATSSRQMAVDVQLLLRRLGIFSGVHSKTMRYHYRGEARERPGFTVHIVGEESLVRFLERVLPQAASREEQVVRFREYLAATQRGLTSKDTVPAAVRAWVDAERRAAGITWRDLEARSGVSIRELCRRVKPAGSSSDAESGGVALVNPQTAAKKGFRRTTIQKLAEFFGSARLAQVAASDIFWDRVVSIEPAGIAETYDLTVEQDHNFVADGLIVHNSHSTAYALIAYMTAYLKAHYPVEFMASLLSGDIPGRNFKKKDSLVEHLEDCRRMNLTVVPPDVNRSDVDFAVEKGEILFGLSAVKGCGGGAGDAIVAERRKNGRFKDIFDFCHRLDSQTCSRATIETLIKAGAFDSMGARRNQLLKVVERAVQSGASAAADRKAGQKNLFGGGDEEEVAATSAEALPDVPELDQRELLQFEKEVLGFYLTAHPLAQHEQALGAYVTHTTADIPEVKGQRQEVVMGGMIASIKQAFIRNPKPGQPAKYANFDLEDTEGIIRCILWPDDFERFGPLVQADAIVVLRGAVDRRGGGDEANLIVNEVIPLGELDTKYVRGCKVTLHEGEEGESLLRQVREIVRTYPGRCELQLLLQLNDGRKVELKSNKITLDAANPEFRRRMEDLLGPKNFQLRASLPKPAQSSRGGNGYGRREGNGWNKG